MDLGLWLTAGGDYHKAAGAADIYMVALVLHLAVT